MGHSLIAWCLALYAHYTWECDIGVSTFLGAIIGLEREIRGKSAGVRTFAIVAMASCLFTILSKEVGISSGNDPTRIAAGIVTGIGFLGAGVIWHKDSGTEGLTTGASLWSVSALSMAIGFGYMSIAITSAITVLVVMEGFGWMVKKTRGWMATRKAKKEEK